MFRKSDRRSFIRIGALAFIAAASLALASAGAAQSPAPEHYTLPFGADKPWAPSQALTVHGGFIAPEQFPDAEYCAKCHQNVHREWRQSAHANSFRTPFYRRNVENLINLKGIEVTRHCEGCHNPVALFSGSLTPNSPIDRSFDEDGVTCAACHSIAKIQNTSGTGSYVMGVPAVMLNEDGTPRPGKVPFDDVFARPDLHRKAVMKDFYRSPEFCAACHKAAMPREINGYKWLRAFSVYDEWQQSSWSKQSPIPFYKKDEVSVCQTCHMPPVESGADYGHKNGKVASHRFLGANTAIPLLYGYDEQLKKLEEFLKDVVNIDIFAVTKGSLSEQPIAPLDKSPFSITPGETLTFDLVIQNRKIGHSLVPEQRDFYESWVEFQVTDAAGNTLYHSGAIEPDGQLDKRAHSYTNRLVGPDSNRLILHEVWRTKARGYDNTILPGRSDLVRYQLRVPEGVKGPLRLTAKVRYRRFNRTFSEWVFKNSPEKRFDIPVMELGSKTVTLALGRNTPAQRETAEQDMLRWNNYGVALLDQQEFVRAEQAFRKVLQLNPRYTDGYINVAVAQYTAGSYNAALKSIRIALQREPNNMRALFYQGLIYRWMYKYDLAIESFLDVLNAYPRLRQARAEVAYVYLQQKKYQQAREHFEKLKEIDPDDLMAHRWLIPVYTALGMKEKAAEEARYVTDRKEDPVAMWTVQEYWRRDIAIANEVVPYHVHSDDPQANAAAMQKILNVANPPSYIWIQGDMDWVTK